MDKKRIIAVDELHSQQEDRMFCIGKVGENIATVRITNEGFKDSANWCWILPKEETIKITLSVDTETLKFFKSVAKVSGTKYQRMMREVLKGYASKYKKSASFLLTDQNRFALSTAPHSSEPTAP